MNLKKLSVPELHSQTQTSAQTERRATTHLLHHLREIERRRAFAVYACDSLHAYCMKHLNFSDHEASIRVNASRLLQDCPEIEERINSGTLSLTSASQAQSFFKKEAKAGNRFSATSKAELLEELDSKVTRKVEQILLSHSTRPAEPVKESLKSMTPQVSELKIAVDEGTLKNLDRLKEIWSHSMPGASYSEIIKKMAEIVCEKEDPLKKAQKVAAKVNKNYEDCARAEVDDEKRSRQIPVAIQRAVFIRDNGCCTFVSHEGQKCESRFKLEFDHILAFAHGGKHTLENLRLRCFAHNQLHSMKTYRRHAEKFMQT